MKKYQTPRAFFYKFEMKVDSDYGMYMGKSGQVRSAQHIAYLGNAVCLDRISIGFVPSVRTKFTGPIQIHRPDAIPGRQLIDYIYESGPIDYEWIRVFNRAIHMRSIVVDDNFRGIALIEEEGKLT